MRLINTGSSPRYSSLAHVQLRPGGMSRELSTFSDLIEKFKKDTSSFEVVMSEKDIRLLAELCRKHIFPKLDDEALRQASGADSLRGALDNPGGQKVLEERALERRKLIQRQRDEAIRSYRENEARIRSESNEVDELGNPITKVSTSAADGIKDLQPQLHKEPGQDLKSVFENNLAVIRSASGQPITNLPPRAPKGGTPVSSNPADYPKTKLAAPQIKINHIGPSDK